jgi:hypothetical protein
MNTAMSRLPELRIAVVNFGSGGIVTGSAERWESVMRWDTTISVLRDWQPHIVLCQEISAGAPGGIRAHLWLTANTLNMVPLLGPPSVGSTAGNHSAVLVTASAGLVIEDASPAWSSDPGAPPAWCDALMQVPGWAQPLRVYSVDLPWRSSVERRSQAERLATRIAELTGAGEPAIAGGNWNSYSRTAPVMPAALEAAPLHLRPSRMRYSAQDRTLTPNYDVHDVLACVGMGGRRRLDACARRSRRGRPQRTSGSHLPDTRPGERLRPGPAAPGLRPRPR